MDSIYIRKGKAWVEKYFADMEKENSTIKHYGVKGMKWGVRRTPEQLGHVKISVDKSKGSSIIKYTISGHESTLKKSIPNSITDHIGKDGKIDVRTYYGKNGMKELDIHTTNHSNSKTHIFGENGEHAHEYEWDNSGRLRKKTSRELLFRERKENEDIL